MPTNQRWDFAIQDSAGNTYGYMLARDPKNRGRAWQRQRQMDSLSTRRNAYKSLFTDAEYGGLPDELDHPDFYDNWAGGFGNYYHVPSKPHHYHIGFGFDTRFPKMLFHAQQPQMLANRYATCNTFVDFFLDVPVPIASGSNQPPVGAGAVLALGRNQLCCFTPTNLPYTAGSAFDINANGPTSQQYGHRPAIFGSYVYLPDLQGSGFVQRSLDGALFTVAVDPAHWFQVANGRLWRGYGRNLVKSCAAGADPLVTANWSATISLSNGLLQSEDAGSFEDHIFVGFPDGLYQGDQTGTFSNILTEVGAIINQDSIRDVSVHNGGLVVAEGSHVWWYKPSSGANSELRQIWPTTELRPLGTFNAPPGLAGLSFKGNVTCLKGFGRWLYAGVFNGSQSIVYCGIDASAPLPYEWHPMQLFSETVKVSRIHVDNITVSSGGVPIPRRIWVATDASFGTQPNCTCPVYYWPIPRDDETPFADTSFSPNYTTQAYLEQAVSDWESPGVPKAWRKAVFMMDRVGTAPNGSAGITVGLTIDGTMAAIGAGSLTFNGAPKSELYFNNQNETALGQTGQLSLYSVLGSGGQTPILRSSTLRGDLHPRSVDVITAKVRIADNISDRQGGFMRPADSMLTELHTFASTSLPFRLLDPVGRSQAIAFLPNIEEEEVYQGSDDYPEIVATARMGVLDASFSTV